jgi:hypothetical protein
MTNNIKLISALLAIMSFFGGGIWQTSRVNAEFEQTKAEVAEIKKKTQDDSKSLDVRLIRLENDVVSVRLGVTRIEALLETRNK